MLVAQITDTHLFADDRQTMFDCATNQTFAAVINAIAQLQPPPDVLLLTGDISQDDTVESYEYARSLIQSLQIPTYWIPGNHDQNTTASARLNAGCISPQKSFSQAGWQFILLDSRVDQQPSGALSRLQLEWLEQELATSLPTLIAVHHHTIACGLSYMDDIVLQNADELLEIIDRHPQVKVVLSGHIHQEFATERHGVNYFGTPSTCIQLKPRQAKIEVDDRPPGFRLLRLAPDGKVRTEVCWVEVHGATVQ
jgi:3',5'-cyclic-AMP phosphodiesterase